MTQQADQQRRNRLLDDLKAALDDYFEAEERRINDEVEFVQSFLRGRTGSERLQRANTQEAEILVFDDIASFLTGGDS